MQLNSKINFNLKDILNTFNLFQSSARFENSFMYLVKTNNTKYNVIDTSTTFTHKLMIL